jgi:uncharacterized protein
LRALLDANILISYLLTTGRQTTITAIVDAGLLGEYTLLMANDLLQGIANKIATKRYLTKKITAEHLTELEDALRSVSERVAPVEGSLPAVTRDPKDDYFLPYAVVGQANYLVSGDDDLLVLGKVEGVRIVRPAEFLELLQQRRTR